MPRPRNTSSKENVIWDLGTHSSGGEVTRDRCPDSCLSLGFTHSFTKYFLSLALYCFPAWYLLLGGTWGTFQVVTAQHKLHCHRYQVLAEAGLQVVPSFNIKSSPSVCQAFQMTLSLHSLHDVALEGSRQNPSCPDVQKDTELEWEGQT